jgi:hypothetical protein
MDNHWGWFAHAQTWIATAALLLAGCSTTIGSLYQPAGIAPEEPRDIFIALDGTGNDQLSRTNVSRLYELVDNSNVGRPRATYYGEGVGTGGRVIGAATGWGSATMSERLTPSS